jgi:hypothetical protein
MKQEDITEVISRLTIHPDFLRWRDEVAKSELDRIEQMKHEALALSEAEVKAVILYEIYLKELFIRSFERAAVLKEMENEHQETSKQEGEQPEIG